MLSETIVDSHRSCYLFQKIWTDFRKKFDDNGNFYGIFD
jgi:hypothetical protein